MLFLDSYRTDLEDYDYCGNDRNDYDPYELFSWRHYLMITAEKMAASHKHIPVMLDGFDYVALRAI